MKRLNSLFLILNIILIFGCSNFSTLKDQGELKTTITNFYLCNNVQCSIRLFLHGNLILYFVLSIFIQTS